MPQLRCCSNLRFPDVHCRHQGRRAHHLELVAPEPRRTVTVDRSVKMEQVEAIRIFPCRAVASRHGGINHPNRSNGPHKASLRGSVRDASDPYPLPFAEWHFLFSLLAPSFCRLGGPRRRRRARAVQKGSPNCLNLPVLSLIPCPASASACSRTSAATAGPSADSSSPHWPR